MGYKASALAACGSQVAPFMVSPEDGLQSVAGSGGHVFQSRGQHGQPGKAKSVCEDGGQCPRAREGC